MEAIEKRKVAADAVKSREGKNTYTQSTRRTLVDQGYSDCSSLVWWAYKKINLNIGDYTGAQINKGTWVTIGGAYPDERELLPGDLLFFSANYNNGRPYRVNHVEMYVGNGELSGHGYGIGPIRKQMQSYCVSRNNSGQHYIGVKRYIAEDGSDLPEYEGKPLERMFVGEVTATRLNVRTGPGTSYPLLTAWPKLNQTNLVDVMETVGSWYYIQIAGQYRGYVSGQYIKRI